MVLDIGNNYKKASVNAVLHAYTSYFVKYGYNETLAQMVAEMINELCGTDTFTAEDIRSIIQNIQSVIDEKWGSGGYYDSKVPRTSGLILRDKVFYARSGAISKWLKEVL